MKQKHVRILSMLIALVMLIGVLSLTALADERTIQVGSDGGYETLAQAIAVANDGDTIELAAGTYTLIADNSGYFGISKRVNIQGAGKDETILTGVGLAFGFGDGDVTVSDLTMKGTGNATAINFQGAFSQDGTTASNATYTVRNCSFENYQYTIGVNSYVSDSKLVLDGCDFVSTGCAAAIQTGAGNDIEVTSTTISSGFAVQAFGGSGDTFYNDFYNGFVITGEPDVDATKNPIVIISDTGSASANGAALRAAINAAKPGEIIVLTAGEYDVDTLTITKPVSILGAGAGETVLNGKIQYAANATATDEIDSITVEGITLKATDSASDKGIRWSIRVDSNSTGSISGFDLNVKDCEIEGFQYGTTVDTGASDCELHVTGTSFDTVCAVSVKEGNLVSAYEGNQQTGFAVQYFSQDFKVNGYYYDFNDFAEDQAAGSFSPDVDAANQKVVLSDAELLKAIADAASGDTIVLAPGTYTCDISFGGKSLTLQGANAGVNPNTDARGAETIFTGTISTYDGSDKFYPEQEVVIDGFKFTGNGLKVGDNNYNSVGNLTVQNCIMETGENLSGNTCGHNSSNYFVKVSGGANQGFANVIVRNNLVTGKAVANVFPIQLWHVKQAVVVNNVIDLDDAAGHEAISVSILDKDAVVDVSGNTISGAGGGIYVTGWKVDGLGEGTPDFTGQVAINNNIITGPASSFDPIFVGYEGAQNGDFAGKLFASGNTYNGSNYVVTATRDPNSTVKYIDVVLKDGREIVDYFTGPKTDDGLTVTLRTLSRKGYTFLGWKSSAAREVYKAGATVKIYEDTTFTAQLMSNWEIVDDIAGAAGSGKEFFTDVKGSAWYYDAVKFVYDNGFMDGVGDNKFNPNGTLTRAMIAQVLYNLEGETSSYPTVFDDVAKSAWYADAVNWAAASGIVEGKGNNKFDPNAAITRQEMAAILYRYSELKGYDVSKVDSLAAFTDANKVASWAKEAMGWAVENYVINGKGAGKLDPTGTATRAEVAQILMNLCNNVL